MSASKNSRFSTKGSNPFDSDDESDDRSAKPYQRTPNSKLKAKEDFQTQSYQELESYAVEKADDTTKTINDCLKIAEDIRETGTQTLVSLHHQGDQITRTHQSIVDVEHDLSRGEKLLGSLGGMFSKTWKPKKNHKIDGPVITRDSDSKGFRKYLEQKAKLGMNKNERSTARGSYPEPTNAMEKIEIEKSKQDDALTDLSNMLGEMKMMAIDMGTEIEWQTKALDKFEDDVDEVNFRLRGAKERGHRLLHK